MNRNWRVTYPIVKVIANLSLDEARQIANALETNCITNVFIDNAEFDDCDTGDCCPACGDTFDATHDNYLPTWSDAYDNIVCWTCAMNVTTNVTVAT